MPKKPQRRINLTISDELYAEICEYKNEVGAMTEASACVQLVFQALREIERKKKLLAVAELMDADQLQEKLKLLDHLHILEMQELHDLQNADPANPKNQML